MSGGGGRRWAVAAALLLVPELVGDGDCQRAHQRGRAPETGGRRRREQRERESPLRRDGRRGLRRRLLLRPLVGARERLTARCPQPPGSLLPALPFPVFPPPTTRAAALTATRTRAPWRTRVLGHLWRLDPLSGLKGLLPRERLGFLQWLEEAAVLRLQICCPLPSCPGSDVLSKNILGGFPHDRSPDCPPQSSKFGRLIAYRAP